MRVETSSGCSKIFRRLSELLAANATISATRGTHLALTASLVMNSIVSLYLPQSKSYLKQEAFCGDGVVKQSVSDDSCGHCFYVGISLVLSYHLRQTRNQVDSVCFRLLPVQNETVEYDESLNVDLHWLGGGEKPKDSKGYMAY